MVLDLRGGGDGIIGASTTGRRRPGGRCASRQGGGVYVRARITPLNWESC